MLFFTRIILKKNIFSKLLIANEYNAESKYHTVKKQPFYFQIEVDFSELLHCEQTRHACLPPTLTTTLADKLIICVIKRCLYK